MPMPTHLDESLVGPEKAKLSQALAELEHSTNETRHCAVAQKQPEKKSRERIPSRHWPPNRRNLKKVPVSRGPNTSRDEEVNVDVHVDSNWAIGSDRKSTSGGMMIINGTVLKHWSRTQATRALSTAECSGGTRDAVDDGRVGRDLPSAIWD